MIETLALWQITARLKTARGWSVFFINPQNTFSFPPGSCRQTWKHFLVFVPFWAGRGRRCSRHRDLTSADWGVQLWRSCTSSRSFAGVSEGGWSIFSFWVREPSWLWTDWQICRRSGSVFTTPGGCGKLEERAPVVSLSPGCVAEHFGKCSDWI